MSGLQKNVASQKWRCFAFDRTTNAPKTGDALNITAKIAKDWGAATALGDTNPTEVEDGYYLFDLTQAETNANWLDLFPESATANIQVVGVPGSMGTVPVNFQARVIDSGGIGDANVEEWDGNAILPTLGKTIYVATTGNDSNPGTAASPKLTINGAVAAMSDGDTCRIGAGTFGLFSCALNNCKFTGVSKSDTIISTASGTAITLTGDFNELRDLTATTTDATVAKYGILFLNTTGTLLQNINANGTYDGIFGPSVLPRLYAVVATGYYDGVNLEGCVSLDARDCVFYSNGNWALVDDAGVVSYSGARLGNGTTGRFVRCKFVSIQPFATGKTVTGCTLGGDDATAPNLAAISFDDCVFDARATHASNTGIVATLSHNEYAGNSLPMRCNLDSPEFNYSNAGSGASYHIRTFEADARVALVRGLFRQAAIIDDVSRVRSDLMPTVAGRTLDVTATGAAGIDWGNVENPSTNITLTQTTIDTVNFVDETATVLSNVTVGGIGANVITAAAIAAGALTSTKFAAGAIDATVAPNLDAAVTTRATPAQVNTEVDTALADIHLDHLLAADYDPAAKPGVATALLNELVESDAGVSRYTVNALEQGPSGGGGGGSPAQVDNSEIVQARVFKLGTRADGVSKATRTCLMKVGEKYPVWIDTTRYSGGWLDNVSNALSSSANLEIDQLGMNREYVVLWLEALAVGAYTARATAHPRAADNLICVLDVEVEA